MAISTPVSSKGKVWQKLLDALYADLGNIVTNQKLMKVSGQHNYARRIRELRAEGWDIVYNPGEPKGYILRSDKQILKDTDKYINLKLRQKILERDRFICQTCGSKAGDVYLDGSSVKLEVDHIKPLAQGGRTVEENLWTLCSFCNAGKKSLLAYPETIKNKIISLNLSDDLRSTLNKLSAETGRTVNDLLLDAIVRGLKKF